MTNREDRIAQLIAACVHNNKTPQNTAAFADFILKVCAATFGSNPQTARAYLKSVISIYRMDKWKSMVTKNIYLSDEERGKWLNEHN